MLLQRKTFLCKKCCTKKCLQFEKRSKIEQKSRHDCNMWRFLLKYKRFQGLNHNLISWLFIWIIRKLIKIEYIGNKTVEKYGSIRQFNHTILSSYFSLLDEKQLRKCFNWIILRPCYQKNKAQIELKPIFDYIFYKKLKLILL